MSNPEIIFYPDGQQIISVPSFADVHRPPDKPERDRTLAPSLVYRPWSIIGCAIKIWEFNLNHGPDLMVRDGTYYQLTVLPGDSIISHDDILFIDEERST